MKLWMLRHARVVLPDGLCYGASDVAAHESLTELAADQWAEGLPAGGMVWASSLARARQLAEAVARRRPDLPAALIDARLAEMDFGHWELQPWADVPRASFDIWMADFGNHRFGGRESTNELLHRVGQALQDCALATRAAGRQDMIWITHAGIIRAVQYIIESGSTRIDSPDQWPKAAPDTGGMLQIDLP